MNTKVREDLLCVRADVAVVPFTVLMVWRWLPQLQPSLAWSTQGERGREQADLFCLTLFYLAFVSRKFQDSLRQSNCCLFSLYSEDGKVEEGWK